MGTSIPRIRRQYFPVIMPVHGLRHDIPSVFIPNEASPKLEDVEVLEGRIRKARGARAFGGTGASPLNGVVMGLPYENDVLFALTTTKIYKFSSGSFSDITVNAHTGDEDNPFSWVYTNDSTQVGHLVWTNGIDSIQKYDFTNPCADLGNAAAYITKWLAEYGGRLNLYNLTDNGTEFPLRVRYCKLGDFEDWSASGASFYDLDTHFDSSDEIMRAEKLSGIVVIYGRTGLVLQEYRGEVANPFAFHGRMFGVGLIAERGLVNVEGNRHFFLGADDVYEYRGGREIFNIGKSIRDELFDRLAPTFSNRSFMVYRPEFECIRLFVPLDDATFPSHCYQYNLGDQSWVLLNAPYTAFGRYVVVDAPTWDDLDIAWDDYALRWNDRTLIALQPYTLYGNDSGVVFQDDDSDYDRAGSAINGWFDTKDFVSGEEFKRSTTDWFELNIEAQGNEVDVYYSVDQGRSYTLIDTITLKVNSWDTYRLDFDINSPQIRFRFKNENSGETFEIKWFELGYIPASDRAVP